MVVDRPTATPSASLLDVLRRVTDVPALQFAAEPRLLTGGFWAELIAFRLADPPPGWNGGLVARIMPDAATAAKETAFQTVVAAQGFATPAVIAAGGPLDGVDGRAFTVMPLVDGAPLLAGLDGVGALIRLPSLARRLPVVLARVLVGLHGLDPAPVVERLDRAGAEHPRLPSMLRRLRDTAGSLARPDLAAAASWLASNAPTGEPIVICHGDMHPFNVLVDDSHGATVIDWSAALLAPPTHDVGFTSLLLAEPPLVVPRPLGRLVAAAGRGLSRRFVRAYERESGRIVDRSALAWHQAVVCLRALVEVAGWVADGTIDDRGDHPWLLSGGTFASRLGDLTGQPVRPR